MIISDQDTRKKILVVDDNQRNREYIQTVLQSEGYVVLEATSGEESLQIASARNPDLIILDAMMPGLDGFRVADQLKRGQVTKLIPIIMVTSLSDQKSKVHALQCGVEEFLSKPVDRAELWVRVRNLLRLKEYGDFLANYNQTLEQQIKERTEQLLSSHIDTIFTITRAAEFRDEETGEHIKRIGYYTKEISARMGMDHEFVEAIYYSSPLHDVGKIGIPDHILLKPGKHSADEWEIMKTHTALGANILGSGNSSSPFTNMGADIALYHHEKWDGTGYPNGLSGEAIPISARIMAITDVYDALRSRRPYKKEFSHEETVQIILNGDGRTSPSDFDPEVLHCFELSHDVFENIYSELSD